MTQQAKRILVTGGAGFIGSAVIRHIIRHTGHEVLNIDKLSYAAPAGALASVQDDPRYRFIQADITDETAINVAFAAFRPDAVMHLAAESHVDRSIDGPDDFIDTNIVGTASLLNVTLAYWSDLDEDAKGRFRFHHVSTDEVFGSLDETGEAFVETTAYAPRSPYAASKAASDHLVRAWHHTYGLPIIITNCSNNYGPYQFPEKLIPLLIIKGLQGEPLPIYGQGKNIRDWIQVEDHARALLLALCKGTPGETYLFGARAQYSNLEIAHRLCDLLDEMAPPLHKETRRHELIHFVADRPGHDFRYAINPRKAEQELGWKPHQTFDQGLRQCVKWYLDNQGWWQKILENRYAGERLGSTPNHKKTGRTS